MCQSSFIVVESQSCADPVSLGLCVNLGLCGCVSTLNPVHF
jgi:hypothetical protein